jgi:hypothetical protein
MTEISCFYKLVDIRLSWHQNSHLALRIHNFGKTEGVMTRPNN